MWYLDSDSRLYEYYSVVQWNEGEPDKYLEGKIVVLKYDLQAIYSF